MVLLEVNPVMRTCTATNLTIVPVILYLWALVLVQRDLSWKHSTSWTNVPSSGVVVFQFVSWYKIKRNRRQTPRWCSGQQYDNLSLARLISLFLNMYIKKQVQIKTNKSTIKEQNKRFHTTCGCFVRTGCTTVSGIIDFYPLVPE